MFDLSDCSLDLWVAWNYVLYCGLQYCKLGGIVCNIGYVLLLC